MYSHSSLSEEIADIAAIDCAFLNHEPLHFNSLTHRISSRPINIPPVYFASKEGFDVTSKAVVVFQHIIRMLLHQSKKTTKKCENLQVDLTRVEAERNEAVAECVKCYDRIRKLEEEVPIGQRQYSIDERKYHHHRHRNHIMSGGHTHGNQGNIAPVVLFPCGICGNTYPSQHSLLSHTTKRHAGVVPSVQSVTHGILSQGTSIPVPANPALVPQTMGAPATQMTPQSSPSPFLTSFTGSPLMDTTSGFKNFTASPPQAQPQAQAQPQPQPFSTFCSPAVNPVVPSTIETQIPEVQHFREELGQVRHLVEEMLHREQVSSCSTSAPSPSPQPSADLATLNQLSMELKKIQDVLQSSNSRLGQMEAAFSSQGYLCDEFKQQQQLLQQFQNKQNVLQDVLRKMNEQGQSANSTTIAPQTETTAPELPSLSGPTSGENKATPPELNRVPPPPLSSLHNLAASSNSPPQGHSGASHPKQGPLQLSSLNMLTEKDLRDILETCVISPMSNFTDRSATMNAAGHPHAMDPTAHSVSPSPSVQSIKNMTSRDINSSNQNNSRGPSISRLEPTTVTSDSAAPMQEPREVSGPSMPVASSAPAGTVPALVGTSAPTKTTLTNTLTTVASTTPIRTTDTSVDGAASLPSMSTPPVAGVAPVGVVPIHPSPTPAVQSPTPAASTAPTAGPGLPFFSPSSTSNSGSLENTSGGVAKGDVHKKGTSPPSPALPSGGGGSELNRSPPAKDPHTTAPPQKSFTFPSVLSQLPAPSVAGPVSGDMMAGAAAQSPHAASRGAGTGSVPAPVQPSTDAIEASSGPNVSGQMSPAPTLSSSTAPAPISTTAPPVPPILLTSVMESNTSPAPTAIGSNKETVPPPATVSSTTTAIRSDSRTPPKTKLSEERTPPTGTTTPKNKVVSITPDTTKRSSKADDDELLVDHKPTTAGSMTPQSLSPTPRQGSRPAARPSGRCRAASATSSSYYYTYSDSDSSYTDSEDLVEFQQRRNHHSEEEDEEDEVSRNEPQVGSEERESLFIESLSGTDYSGRKVNITDLTEKKKKSYGIFKKMFSKK